MKKVLILGIGLSLIMNYSCIREKAKSHTETLIIINADVNRYEAIFINEVDCLYKQIEKIEPSDSSKIELVSKAYEIQKHSNELIESINNTIIEKSNAFSLEMPTFSNLTVEEWNKTKQTNFYLNNKYDEKAAFSIKEALTSYHMHLAQVNQKYIQSLDLENVLKSSIRTYNYFMNESWEKTLISNKTSLDLISTLNKIKFEIKMSEYFSIKYLKEKLEE
ncbi:MAG: hypothetical protein AB7S48_02615 [Bacteroidales bacterium]